MRSQQLGSHKLRFNRSLGSVSLKQFSAFASLKQRKNNLVQEIPVRGICLAIWVILHSSLTQQVFDPLAEQAPQQPIMYMFPKRDWNLGPKRQYYLLEFEISVSETTQSPWLDTSLKLKLQSNAWIGLPNKSVFGINEFWNSWNKIRLH